MNRMAISGAITILLSLVSPWLAPATGVAQETAPPALRAGALPQNLVIDGVLDEPAWRAAEATDSFTQTDPAEGARPRARTVVRVLANARSLVIGIVCDDPDPTGIVSFSARRDAALTSEDHVRVVIGPFRDGRSGYVFAVNPTGARYDGLINPGGETDNPDWDGIWDSATARTSTGWSVELAIPVQTLSFKPGLHEWHFNVQRRIQRFLETDRWAFPARQYQVTQTSRAGLLASLPDFTSGLGLSVRPAVTTGGGVPAAGATVAGEVEPSLDVVQRLGANVSASLTANTDFAETEVDTRRTNLTRFPLFFPEKRTFFLEGADIFSFGLGLGQDVIPFFSRTIGLLNGTAVPIAVGAKVNGRLDATNVGGLAVDTREKAGVTSNHALMAVGRVKQNIWKESWVGAIVTTGDPRGRTGSGLAGADFTYATSRFRGDRNLRIGVWGLAAARADLRGDAKAYGFMVDYPNDRWDIALTYKRIGRDFDPSLGFVPRRAVHLYNFQANNRTRLSRGPLQQLTHEFEPFVATDLSGRWESYRVFMAPINWRFRSGDRLEFNINPTGERIDEPTEIGGVTIDPGRYHWRRYRLEAGSAQKRRLYVQATWWFGGFYDGRLDQFQWTGSWNPTPLVTMEFTGERDMARGLRAGDFAATLVGVRTRLNVSPNLNVASYVQYDTASAALGVNSRLRWTFKPAGDLFIVYNHNLRNLVDRWRLESNQLLVKLQYAFRY